MQILLLGKDGLLGQALNRSLCCGARQIRKIQLTAWGREELDIIQPNQVLDKISQLEPDLVINTTGYTKVDGAETETDLAYQVNSTGVGYIAQVCSQIGAILIHFSTDYVFDGTQAQGYLEDELERLCPLNVYGESKLAGERKIIETKILTLNPAILPGQNHNLELKTFKYFIIRTSWLYGAGGNSFVNTLLKRAVEGQIEFKVVNDQFGLPTYTVGLAERVRWIVERIDELPSGVYHVTDSKPKIQTGPLGRRLSKPQLKTQNSRKPAGITWYELAMEIFRQAKTLGILSKLPRVEPCRTDEFPRPARRPKYSVLLNTKLPEMRGWREALQDYLKSFDI